MTSKNLFFDQSKLKRCGKGCIIGLTARIRKPEKVSLGTNSIIDDFTYIPCELAMGSYSHIGSGCHLIGGKGKVTIGNFVNIAPGCNIVTAQDDYRGGGLTGAAVPEKYSGKAIVEPVHIGDHALLGCGTVVLPGVKIPEGMAAGALTLLNKQKYEPWTLYAGIPAKKVGRRDGALIKAQAKKLLQEEGE
ncbi:2,3,4,5-tetrahydropyridine-2,6-dicarboxylate N-acetyltransferase [Candidatus Burarchaeum australiense]|nr:2,3,4,5-tetrahydropyridine-2,6-dicarboxylate N-acetyltransferase [Candidatus Burarchaeum australiense]